MQRGGVGGARFQHSLLGLNRQIDGTGTTYYTSGNGGELLGQRAPAGRYYYRYGGLGSTAALTDSAGSVATTYRYDPWGKQIASTATVATPYRFGGSSGAYTDAATGLVKIGQRYYDPSLGRRTQMDPLGAGNPYAYTNCNPINSIDPSGRASGPTLACYEALGALISMAAANVSFVATFTGGGAVAAIAGLVFYFGSIGPSAAGYIQSLQGNPTYFDVTLNAVLFVAGLRPGVPGLGANIISVIAACAPKNGLPSP